MTVFILFASLVVCFALGMPIAFSLGVSCLCAIVYMDVPTMVIAQKLLASNDSFPFLAIPLFTLAGAVMTKGGLSRRLVNLASLLVYQLRIPGGLAVVAVLGSMFFAAISGSPVSTVAAVGSILIPSMVARGYTPAFCGAIQAAAGPLGAMIPPSIGLIVYGVSVNQSISKLFLATAIPGLLMGIALMLISGFLAARQGFGQNDKPERSALFIWKDSFWALLLPVIILGGIYGGVFTPTEAAGVAVVYGYLAGFVIYRELTVKQMWESLIEAAVGSAMIMIIINFSSLFSWLVATYRIPQIVSAAIFSVTTDPLMILLILNLFMLVVGTFMETSPAIVILAPVFLPIAVTIGIDPIHFGIIMVVNLLIGLVTPPVGLTLFMASRVANAPVDDIIRNVWIPLGIMILMLIPINLFPQLSLYLLQFMR